MAVRDLMLGDALVKRLVNHAPSRDLTGGYAVEWTLEQLRAHSQRIAGRIEALAVVESRDTPSALGASTQEAVVRVRAPSGWRRASAP